MSSITRMEEKKQVQGTHMYKMMSWKMNNDTFDKVFYRNVVQLDLKFFRMMWLALVSFRCGLLQL